MIRSSLVALALAVTAPLAAQAQSLSAEDILAQVDKKVASGNEYQALLADPDLARSMAAMQIMLDSGDPDLMRIALNAGLFSPNPAVQRNALDAFFRASPVVNVYVDGSTMKDSERLSYWINRANGTVDAKSQGYMSFKVGEYNAESSCYLYSGVSDCMFRINDDGISFHFFDRWSILRLNDQAELVGTVVLPDVTDALPLRIPVTN